MEKENKSYVLTFINDVLFLMVILMLFIFMGPLTFNTTFVFSVLLFFGGLSLIVSIYCYALNEDDLRSQAEILRICSNLEQLNSYNFCKLCLGYGALSYIAYSVGAVKLSIFIAVFIILNVIGMFLVKKKNDVLFRKFKRRK